MHSKGPHCAVYTRKSSEEGLEQAFNSLDAQREACEAYIKSQAGEGWQPVKASYDDGGVSGGTLERPALQRLLDDIRARKVDVIVVYKVDRLTRSLADFAKIVEVFDTHNVSFVSVTQAFNTTTSMGRLTLNMLLSFAQFEREVTGERIRDKIAASKRKGMWMGGFVPLGYDARDRSLVINEAEAETVRTLFRLYLTHGSVSRVKEEADRLGLRSKRSPGSEGRMQGGRELGRGYLYKLLGNPLYAGKIAHKDQVHDGQHEAIIEPETWEAVQAKLAGNAQERRTGARAAVPSLLAGLLYDDQGHRLSPSHAAKLGKRYRYYVSQAVLQHVADTAASVVRIPAHEIEDVVVGRFRALLKDQAFLLDTLAGPDAPAREQQRLLSAADDLAARWPTLTSHELHPLLASTITSITIRAEEIDIYLSRVGLRAALLGGSSSLAAAGKGSCEPSDSARFEAVAITVPARLKSCSGELRLVVPPGPLGETPPRPNKALIKALGRGWAWKERVFNGSGSPLRMIAEEEGLTGRYVSRLIRLTFLAPDIVEAILGGRQPADLELQRMLANLPLSWAEQRRRYGFASRA